MTHVNGPTKMVFRYKGTFVFVGASRIHSFELISRILEQCLYIKSIFYSTSHAQTCKFPPVVMSKLWGQCSCATRGLVWLHPVFVQE